MATYSSILDWRIPWKEKPGGPQSMGSQIIRYDLKQLNMHTYILGWLHILLSGNCCLDPDEKYV